LSGFPSAAAITLAIQRRQNGRVGSCLFQLLQVVLIRMEAQTPKADVFTGRAPPASNASTSLARIGFGEVWDAALRKSPRTTSAEKEKRTAEFGIKPPSDYLGSTIKPSSPSHYLRTIGTLELVARPPLRHLGPLTAASRTPPWLPSGWGCRGRRLARGERSADGGSGW
jgi:hypothetical protein